MELLFSRPLIRGAVNGTEPVAMLIDPELDTTRLTPALAKRLRLSAPRNRDSGSRAAVELAFGSQPPRSAILMSRRSSRVPGVRLKTLRRLIPCRIDGLYPGSVLLPLTYLSELRFATKPGVAEVLKTRGVVSTAREARLADDATVAGVTLTSPLVQFGGKSDIAVVGHRFLTSLSITYDVTRQRAQFNRPPQPAGQ